MTDPNAPSNSSEHVSRESRAARTFEASAAQPERGLLIEFWQFLRHMRSWWLIPIIVGVALLGFALLVGSGPLAPLLYALF